MSNALSRPPAVCSQGLAEILHVGSRFFVLFIFALCKISCSKVDDDDDDDDDDDADDDADDDDAAHHGLCRKQAMHCLVKSSLHMLGSWVT